MNDTKPEKTGIIRDEKGRFPPGVSGNPEGKPKGTLSFMTRIKQFLMQNPEKFEELCQYYIENKRMRELLLKMVDGQPKQNIEHDVGDTIEEVNINIKGRKDE